MAYAPSQSTSGQLRGLTAAVSATGPVWAGESSPSQAGMAGFGGKLGGAVIRAPAKPAAPPPAAPTSGPSSYYQPPPSQSVSPVQRTPMSYGGGGSFSAPNVMELWQGSSPSPSSGPDQSSNDQTSQALTGLQGAFKQVHGPSPGWADDAPLDTTAGQLAQRTPSAPVTTLLDVVRRFGKAY